MREYENEDVGNIVALEHINVQVPDQQKAILFYVVGMGFTRDPYLTVGLGNMWINVGEQQFHLPTRPAQVIDGKIGVVVPDLDALVKRLEGVAEGLRDTGFSYRKDAGTVLVTCPWGNRFCCHGAGAPFGEMALGIPYVEFHVPRAAAGAIGSFYQTAFGAPANVGNDAGAVVASVGIGRGQALRFRETEEAIAPYDGHHVAVYVANFSGPYAYLKSRGLISEDVRNHQFRFQSIVDPQNEARVFSLEHEVRSLRHPMYQRPFVNRDPGQSQRAYHRGWDAFVPFQR